MLTGTCGQSNAHRAAHQRSLRETSGGFAEGLDCGQGIPKWQVSGAPIVFPQDFHRLQKRLRRLPIFSVDRKLNIVDCQNISSIVETISSIANVFLRLQQRYRRLSIFCGDCKNDNGDVQCLSSIVTTISSAANILRRLQKRYGRTLIFFGDSRHDILSVRVLLTNLTVPSFRLRHLPKRYCQLSGSRVKPKRSRPRLILI